jgi:hypothetical protein
MAKMTDTAAQLDRARSLLAETESKLEALSAKRKSRLLAGDHANALARLDQEIASLRHVRTVESDRIEVLQSEREREEAEERAQKRDSLTKEFEAILARSDAAGEELQSAVARVEEKFREVIRLREAARAMWPIGDSHTNAVAETAEGAALSAPAVKALLQFEMYRVGARVYQGGAPNLRPQVSLPGSACPDLRLQMTPEKITPFATALKQKSQFAVSLMREKLDPLKAVPRPATAVENIPADLRDRLSGLLARQKALSGSFSPEDEAEYTATVNAIAAVQTEIAGAST